MNNDVKLFDESIVDSISDSCVRPGWQAILSFA